MCVYLIKLPLTIFLFLRAYRASVAHCVIVFISSYWDRVNHMVPVNKKRSSDSLCLLVATSENDTVHKLSKFPGQP